MGKKGNSGYIGIDKRFGVGGASVKGNIGEYQHFLERLEGRYEPIGDLPDPKVWYDADSDNITTVSYLGSDRVQTWSDRSGNGINATNSGSNVDKPFYDTSDPDFNDLPSVEFGTNDYLQTADDSQLDVNGTGGFTVYVVFDFDSTPGTFSMLTTRTNGTTWKQGWGILFYNNKIRFWVNDWSPDDITEGAYAEIPEVTSVFGPHIYKFHYDETTITGQVFGYSAASDTEPYTDSVIDPSSGIELARGNNSQYDINGSIAEYMFYTKPLSTNQQTAVEDYLSNKYNISLI